MTDSDSKHWPTQSGAYGAAQQRRPAPHDLAVEPKAARPRDGMSLGSEQSQVAGTMIVMLATLAATMIVFFLFNLSVRNAERIGYLFVLPAAWLGYVALRRGHVRLVVHAFIVGCLIAINGFTLVTGGPHSASQLWTAGLPLMIAALLPLRVAAPWCVIILLNQLGLLICYRAGWYSSSLLDGTVPTLAEFTPDFLLAPLVIAAFAGWAARNTDRILKRTERAASVLRLILDELSTQILIIDRDGKLTKSPHNERTPLVEEAVNGDSLIALLHKRDNRRADSFAVGLDALVEEALPMALLLEQMPSEWKVDGRDLHVAYHPIWDSLHGPWTRLALAVTDVTDQRAKSRLQQERASLARIFNLLRNERESLVDFVRESERLIVRIDDDAPGDDWLRALHTLKGNAAVFSLEQLSDACHRAEELALVGSPLQARELVRHAWADWRTLFDQLTDQEALDNIELGDDELDQFQRLLDAGAGYDALEEVALSWTHVPVRRELERLGARAPQVAERLGKPEPRVHVSANDIRVEKARWQSLWSALTHAIRNAVDHGLESAQERKARNKPERGTLSLSAELTDTQLLLHIKDDGRGIDWPAVRAKAESLGLDVTGEQQLDWLAADGVSTRERVDEISGRGIGLAALAEAVAELDGTMSVDSTPHQGCTWTLAFPHASMHAANARHATPSDVNRALAAAS